MTTPKYAAIADKYRELIDTGQLKHGDKLPGITEIAKSESVSRTTVIAAMQQLNSEGLIDAKSGSGTTVRNRIPLVRIVPERYYRPHVQPTWAREAERSGRSVNIDYESRREPASANIAARLGINTSDDVIATRYLITMDNQAITKSTAYEPYALVGGTDIERPHEGSMAGRGIVPRFDSIGMHVTRVHEVLKFRAPTADEARDLSLTSAQWVVEVTQTFRIADGQPIETADIVFPAQRYEFHFNADIPVPKSMTDATAVARAVADGGDGMPWPLGTD